MEKRNTLRAMRLYQIASEKKNGQNAECCEHDDNNQWNSSKSVNK